jgi:hypothetical protein
MLVESKRGGGTRVLDIDASEDGMVAGAMESGRRVIAVNGLYGRTPRRYAAIAHAERHFDRGDRVFACGPTCPA